jgi:uncharacterized alpha/beta hydrolase family protein
MKKYFFAIIILIVVIFLFLFILNTSTKKTCDRFINWDTRDYLTQEISESALQESIENAKIKFNSECCFKQNIIKKSFCILKG